MNLEDDASEPSAGYLNSWNIEVSRVPLKSSRDCELIGTNDRDIGSSERQ
jgi:hypothetical protein